MADPLVSRFERDSALWKRLKAHYEARLLKLRTENDGNMALEQTAKLRGRIAEVKALLALDLERPAIQDDSATFKD